MKEKPFEFGMILGRFQVLHTGHEDMIGKTMELCERTAVFVGSSQESGTRKNPFSYEMRRQMLKTVFGDGIEVYPMPDAGLGNVACWGNYVLDNVKKQCGRLPDLLVSGKEERRTSWYDGPEGAQIAELSVPKTIEISASQMREFFMRNDRESWLRYVNQKLAPMYEEMRGIVLSSRYNTETRSI